MTTPTDTRYARISLAAHLAALTLLCLLFFRPSDQAQCAPVVQSATLPPAPPAQAEAAPQQAPMPDPQPTRPRAPRVALPAPVRAPEPLAAVPDPAPLAMTPVTRSAIDAYRASIRPAQPLENPQ